MMNRMMQSAFRIQIAMMAHHVTSAFLAASGDQPLPAFDKLDQPSTDAVVKQVDFWLMNPDAPVSAAHEHWLATRVAEGWRLSETVDVPGQLSPFIRPFDSLPKVVQMREAIFKAVVQSVTYTRETMPLYMQRAEMIRECIRVTFPEIEDPVAAAEAWNALTEEERQVEVGAMQEKIDAKRDRANVQRLRIQDAAKHFNLTEEQWNAMGEDERVAKLNEHGAITGQGDFYNDEEKAAMLAFDQQLEATPPPKVLLENPQ